MTSGSQLPPALPTEPGADINNSTGTNGFLVVCKTAGFVEFYHPQKFTLIDEIKLPDFPHEVVLSPDRTKAYVSIYGNGVIGANLKPGTQIAVIDLATRRLDGFIELAPFLAPHGLMFDRAGLLWTTAESSNAIVAVDPVRGIVAAHVEIGSQRTHWLAITPDGGKLYAPHRALTHVSVVDVATRAVIKRIPNFIYECQGIAVAPDGNRVYQAQSARPRVDVIDPKTDSVVASASVRDMQDVPPQLTRLRVTPDNRHVVMTFHVTGQVAVFDTQDLTRQHVIASGKGTMGIAFQDAGGRAFVTNHDEGSISVLDLGDRRIEGRIPTRMGPEMIACY
ncbi:MAG TPA: YncE family protein [Tepidisphaeraceae bacterium]|nr:YncE family protein [Tepidisphaeraceae bacterium]